MSNTFCRLNAGVQCVNELNDIALISATKLWFQRSRPEFGAAA